MSFEKTRLPSSLIPDLYRDFLIDETPAAPFPALHSNELPNLENNEKNILVIVDIKNEILQDSDSGFLTGILAACKLNITDVALINLGLTTLSLSEILKKHLSEKVLLFGIRPDKLDLPMRFPDFQVQRFNGKVYLTAPSLSEIARERPLKKLLWESLQKIF